MVLTGNDARKFVAQITYGRPKAAARETARRGSLKARELAARGFVRLAQ